ncbi:transmembrane protein 272 isoform X2 [Halyomorpha halys]|uniref:transmembrane protein 272 isoform X2 n=1 Tax=Halyomorpha halys TaxID=286706 RepID=UPI0006D4D5DB|nr:uncharacterized protein LOC106682117 [Halyomorpha halys]
MASKDVTVYLSSINEHEPVDRSEQQSTVLNSLERVQFTMEATERGPPPTYEEAMDPSRAPPPSYESVIGRVREVHKQSSGTIDFLKKLIILLVGTIGCTIAIGITIFVPVAMFLIGLHYLNECPVNVFIPIYLLVGGFVGVLKQVLQILYRVKRARNRNDNEEEPRSSFQSVITCFMLSWFFLGSYWVYKEYKPNYDPREGPYCNKTVYLFAFWQITIVYVTLSLLTFCLCSISLCVITFAHSQMRMNQLDNSSSP